MLDFFPAACHFGNFANKSSLSAVWNKNLLVGEASSDRESVKSVNIYVHSWAELPGCFLSCDDKHLSLFCFQFCETVT